MSNLKALIERFNQEKTDLKRQVILWQRDYMPDKVLELESKKKKEINESYLSQINELISGLVKPEDLNKKLIKHKYPASFGNEKIAGEMQINNAQSIIASGDEEKILQQLELAISTERYDLVSYALDSLLPNNKGTVLEVKLKSIEEQLNKALNLKDIFQEIKDAKRERITAEIFLRDVIADRETAVYPYTMSEIRIMPQNFVAAQLDRVTRSLEINSMVE